LELRAQFAADVLLGALRELTDLADRPCDVLDELRELVRTEDEHGKDNERHQLERSYVIEHLKLLAMSSVLGPRWSVRVFRGPGRIHGTRRSRTTGTVPRFPSASSCAALGVVCLWGGGGGLRLGGLCHSGAVGGTEHQR